MRNRFWVVVAALTLPTVVGEPAGAFASAAYGDIGSLVFAVGVVQPDPARILEFHLDGRITGEVHDDRVRVIQASNIPDAPALPRADRISDPVSSHGAGRMILRALDSDATLIVLPVTGHTKLATSEGWTVGTVEDQLLEDSHLWEASSGSSRFYEYRATNDIAWKSPGDTNWTTSGSFDVYLWGIHVEIHDAQGTTTLATGLEVIEQTPITREEHYRHAILHVEGQLTMTTAGVHAYADVVELQPQGAIHLAGARGVARAPAGTYALSGDVQLRDGHYQVAFGDGSMDVAVLVPPAGIQGAGAVLVDENLRVPVRGLATAAAAALATIIFVKIAARLGWLGPCDTWIHRADTALNKGAPRRARLFVAVALATKPRDGHARILRGHIRMEAGHRRLARRDYERAFRVLKGREDQAVAAYELGRLHARDKDRANAEWWLDRAIALKPDLLQDATQEPDFHALVQDPVFRARMGAHLGLDEPQP